MHYHAIVETTEKNRKNDFEKIYELNCQNTEDIIENIVTPYVSKETIYIDGRYVNYSNIRSLKIKSSEKTLDQLVDIAQRGVSPGVFFIYTQIIIVNDEKYTKDITKEMIKSVGNIFAPSNINEEIKNIKMNNKIFIVHGRDDSAKNETARFIEKLGLEAIILHEQANSGNTIIEKIEEHTNVGFAVVLYTPCDIGHFAVDGIPKSRARQNVVFEHGYLIGKLSRSKVCALVKGDIETPNDISGVVYIQFDSNEAWRLSLAKELRKAGYSIDLNKIL